MVGLSVGVGFDMVGGLGVAGARGGGGGNGSEAEAVAYRVNPAIHRRKSRRDQGGGHRRAVRGERNQMCAVPMHGCPHYPEAIQSQISS